MTPEAPPGPIAGPTFTPPSTAGMTTRVVKGGLWTLGGQLAPLAVSLVTTPFVIRMLGADAYGVWVLVWLVPSYIAFADLGMSLASTKFGSTAYAEGDTRREAGIVRTAAVIAMASALPAAAVIFAFSEQIAGVFNVPAALTSDASLALKLTAVSLVLGFLSTIFNTPELVRLRMDLNAMVTSGFRIAGLIAAPFAIYYAGIAGGAAVMLAANVLTLAGHLAIGRRLNKHVLETEIVRTAVTPMLKFGAASAGAGIAAILLVNVEKGILSATVSSTALAHYSIAFTLASMLTMFSGAMVQSLLPAFSQLQTPERRAQLTVLYSRGIRLSLIWMVPAVSILAIIARPFFAVWAGEEFARASSLPFYVLLAGLAFNIVAFLPNTAIMAAGRTDALAKLYWGELVVYTGLVWILASRFGAVGAAIAWSVRVITDAGFQFVLARRLAGVEYRSRGMAKFLAAALVMIVPIGLAFYIGRIDIIVVLAAPVCLAIYALLIWKYLLESDEITWIEQRFRIIAI